MQRLGVQATATRQRDMWSWVGIWIVGATAAIWSFTSLSALAEQVHIDSTIALPFGLILHISWGLPLTIDVLAVVATRVWLRGTAPKDAVQYACRAAWVAIGASVAGNAYHGWLVGGRVDTVLISAVPAVVIGALVHLAVLVGRQAAPQVTTRSPGDLPPSSHASTPLGDVGGLPAGEDEPWEAKRDRLLLEGAGRKVLAAELGISEWEARQLLQARASEREGLA